MNIEWIRKGLMRPGKSQRGLAAALGLDPAAVNRLLKNTRQLKASEIERAQAYLEGPPDERRGPAPSVTHPTQRGNIDRLPVLGMAECGADGWSLWNGEVVDYVPRPANLTGAQQAYAVYVTGESMEPRYSQGELVFIHPAKPLTPRCYVLVQMRPTGDGESPRAVLKRLVRRTGTKVALTQFNPPKNFDLDADEILSIHRVVGSGEP